MATNNKDSARRMSNSACTASDHSARQLNFWKGLEAKVTIDNLTNHNYYPYLGESVSGVGRNYKLSVSQRF